MRQISRDIGKMGFRPRYYRGHFYAPERGIMPRYDDDVRNAKLTAERFERQYERNAKEAALCQDKQAKNNLLFGNWMISRRIGSYNYFYECQLEGRHEVAHVINGKEVCTCGLIAEGDASVGESEGHL